MKISIILAECEKCGTRDNVILVEYKGKQKAICTKCLTEIINSLLQIDIWKRFFDFIEKGGLNEGQGKK